MANGLIMGQSAGCIAEKVGQIPNEMMKLHDAITNLAEQINEMDHRMQTLLRVDNKPEVAKPSPSAPDDSLAPLADQLRSERKRVDNLFIQVAFLVERLEL